MSSTLSSYIKLMRLDKPIGIYLLLWPTLWSLWIANKGLPQLKILVVFILGVVIMRSAGCVINDIADRNFDGKVARTKNRPLVSGQITLPAAIFLFISLCCLALLLVLQLNVLTIKLSFIAMVLATFYPFAKRFTHFPQVILGAAFGWSVPMAFSASTNSIPANAWLIYAIAILWPVAYDTIYALMDKEDDLLVGIKSTAILFGNADKNCIFFVQSLVLISLFFLGSLLRFSFFYYFGVVVAGFMMLYQYHLVTNKQFDKAFKNNNWLGLVIFVAIALSYSA